MKQYTFRRNTLALSASLLISLAAMAQPTGYKRVPATEQAALQKQVSSITAQTKSLQSNFTQEISSSLLTEKAVSKGRMYYRAPADLRWEYTSPTPHCFILRNGQSKQNAQNRMFQGISKLIVGLISGEELQNTQSFAATYYLSPDKQTLWAELRPKDKRLQQMFTNMSLCMDLKTGTAHSIVLVDATGDSTTINFSNQRRDETLSDKLFVE